MAKARERSEWRRTAETLSLLANVNRDPKRRSRPFTADDFDPWGKRDRGRKAGITMVVAADMRTALGL